MRPDVNVRLPHIRDFGAIRTTQGALRAYLNATSLVTCLSSMHFDLETEMSQKFYAASCWLNPFWFWVSEFEVSGLFPETFQIPIFYGKCPFFLQ